MTYADDDCDYADDDRDDCESRRDRCFVERIDCTDYNNAGRVEQFVSSARSAEDELKGYWNFSFPLPFERWRCPLNNRAYPPKVQRG